MTELTKLLRYLGELARLRWQADKQGLPRLAAELDRLIEDKRKPWRAGQGGGQDNPAKG